MRYKGPQFKATIDIFQHVMRDLRKNSWNVKGVKFPNKVQEGFTLMAYNNFNSVDDVKRKVTGWVEKDGQKFGPAPEVRTQELERRANEHSSFTESIKDEVITYMRDNWAEWEQTKPT